MNCHIRRILGLAGDEIVLVTAMVGSAGAFLSVVVPWEAVFTSSSDRAVNYLTQIEQANETFYDLYRKWPYQMTNGAAANNAAALVTKNALAYPHNHMENYKKVLEDGTFDITSKGIELRHSFGQGGRILQKKSKSRFYRMDVVFENMPYEEAKAMDKKIDGKESPNNGRVKLRFHNGQVDVIFKSNKV